MLTTNRRTFLGATAGGLAGVFGNFLGHCAAGTHLSRGFGPLRNVADQATGLDLLRLPEGFRYISYGWTGDRMSDGSLTPQDHDGMGVVSEVDGIVTLVRNHEIKRPTFGFAKDLPRYDKHAGGGCATLRFDSRKGQWLDSVPSLAGTVKNCAGGVTPWGTWLSCEESVLGVKGIDDGEQFDFEQEHGWVFEVKPGSSEPPVPLKAMGRFVHEAVAVDPETGIVYMTEDRTLAGFYRFIPDQPGKLEVGGRLEMMKLSGRDNVCRDVLPGQKFDVSWVPIEDPERAHSPGSTGGENPAGDEHGVYHQGKDQGAVTFARLEGCWYGNDVVYLDSTSGGQKELGQIWQYDPRENVLQLILESPGAEILDSPDNLTVSPRGGVVLCEDGDVSPHRIHGMTPAGELFRFAENNVVLKGERNGHAGDFRAEEWAGACFSMDGQWLFLNIQTPGITFAITGPWQEGLL